MNIAEKVVRQKQDFDDVYEAGKKAEYVAYSDALQNYGNRKTYNYAFAYWGKFEYIRLNHKIVPTDAGGCYAMFLSNKSIKKIEAEYFDFSQKPKGTNLSTSYGYTFNSCSNLEEIEDIGLIPEYDYNNTFGYCSKLHTIAKMGVDENTKFTNTFAGCGELVNLTLVGTIGQNGFDVHWSKKLSATSLYSIITALSPTFEGTIILPTTAETNYNDNPPAGAPQTWAELVSTKPNWNITYLEV